MAITIGHSAQRAIEIAFKANQPVMFRGKTGVGKSALIAQAAINLGIGYIVRDLSLMEPADLVGIPFIKDGVTHFAAPAFLPRSGTGILMFEEMNRAPAYMLAPTLELLTSRTLNDYHLPEGWLPAAAINPDTEEYSGTRALDAALLARFMIIDVEASPKEWATWAKKNGVDQRVITFVERTPEIFGSTESNPRGWTKVSNVLVVLESTAWDQDLAMNCFGGLVGEKMASCFLSFILKNPRALPTSMQILTEYPRYRVQVKKLAKANDTAALHALVNSVLLVLQDPEQAPVQDQMDIWAQNIFAFTEDLPAEHRLAMNEALGEETHHAR